MAKLGNDVQQSIRQSSASAYAACLVVGIDNCCKQAITLIDPGQGCRSHNECNGDITPTALRYRQLHGFH